MIFSVEKNGGTTKTHDGTAATTTITIIKMKTSPKMMESFFFYDWQQSRISIRYASFIRSKKFAICTVQLKGKDGQLFEFVLIIKKCREKRTFAFWNGFLLD
jgi:hypothetical protein